MNGFLRTLIISPLTLSSNPVISGTVNGVETGNTRTWSVEAYVGEIRNGTLPLKIAMANALLTYGDSAAAYFAAQ